MSYDFGHNTPNWIHGGHNKGIDDGAAGSTPTDGPRETLTLRLVARPGSDDPKLQIICFVQPIVIGGIIGQLVRRAFDLVGWFDLWMGDNFGREAPTLDQPPRLSAITTVIHGFGLSCTKAPRKQLDGTSFTPRPKVYSAYILKKSTASPRIHLAKFILCRVVYRTKRLGTLAVRYLHHRQRLDLRRWWPRDQSRSRL